MSKNICVVGSARMDVVVRAGHFPAPGETVVGEGSSEEPGGHGLTQAVMASRLGAQVSFVGRTGDDERGSLLRTFLAADGVDIQHLRTSEGVPTGVGIVTVAADGSFAGTAAPGAAAELTAADIDEASKEIRSADLVILQAEAPGEANTRAIELARDGTQILFHATPAAGLDTKVLDGVDLLAVNRAEAAALVGGGNGEISPAGLARRLACLGPERVVITLALEGAIHFNGQEIESFEGFPGKLVDRLGTDDAFVGSLAVTRAEGARLKDAVRFACASASLSGRSAGGCASLLNRERVEELLRKEPRQRSATSG